MTKSCSCIIPNMKISRVIGPIRRHNSCFFVFGQEFMYEKIKLFHVFVLYLGRLLLALLPQHAKSDVCERPSGYDRMLKNMASKMYAYSIVSYWYFNMEFICFKKKMA